MNTHVAITADASGLPGLALPGTAKPARKPRRTLRRRARLAAIGVLLLAAAAGAFWALRGEAKPAVPMTVAATLGTVQTSVLASGTLEANSLVSVGAQVSGTIKTLNVKLGDQVKAGDVIAEIDSLTQTNKVKAATAALAIVNAQKAEEQVNFTKVDKAASRAAQLLASKQLSEADYDTAAAARDASSAQLQAINAQIQQATLNVESAQLDLSRTTITAPVGGTVVAILVDQGQTVSAAQSAPTLVKIADLDSMIIKARISEADVTKVQPGQKATFTVLGDPTPVSAVLRSIDPAPESIATDTATTDTSNTAIYYNGVFAVPNPDHRLRISMTAAVTIVLGEAHNVLTVPSSALTTAKDGATSVHLYDPATSAVEVRKVTVGLNNKVTAEIKSGLTSGDRVIAGGTGATASATGATQGQGAARAAGAALGGFAGGRPPGG